MSRFRVSVEHIATWVIDVDAISEQGAREMALRMVAGRPKDRYEHRATALPLPELPMQSTDNQSGD